MEKKTVMLVLGTRPDAIKMAPLVKEFQKNDSLFRTVICVTGQHRGMLDRVLHFFEIMPDFDLNIMRERQDLYDITVGVLLGMRDVFTQVRPDVVLVQGDTTTSAAAAVAAYYHRIPVGHVEAGLRTRNIYSPWPEEVNRQITGRIASLHFSPTPLCEKNLLEEKVQGKVFVTGNTVIDALWMVVNKLKVQPALAAEQETILMNAGYDVRRAQKGIKKIILVTGHRRESFGDGVIRIAMAVRDLSEKYPEVDFVFPVHMNPNVRKPVFEVLGTAPSCCRNVFLLEPLEYLTFVYLLERSFLVLTDSGGIQEEAPGLGKPVLVMRDMTERPEALESGNVRLVGTDHDLIVSEVRKLIDNPSEYDRMSKAVSPYGDGKASVRIVEALKSFYG